MSSNLPDETNFFYNPYLLPPENDSPDTAIPFYTDHDIDLQPYTSSPNNEFPFKAENRTETDSRDSENETFINIPQTPYTTTSMTWMPQPSPCKIFSFKIMSRW